MSALTIRNIPEKVHNALRKIAAKRGVSVEALAREALRDVANAEQRVGIDFDLVQRVRASMGLTEDGPEWGPDLDDPALSRKVLGLED